jgi:hypothetical protein
MAAAAQPPQQIFYNSSLTTVRQDIRDIIIGIKHKLRNANYQDRVQYNETVNQIVEQLDELTQRVNVGIGGLANGNGDESSVTVNIDANGEYQANQEVNYGGPGHRYIENLQRLDNGLVGINADNVINMNSLDDIGGTLGSIPQVQTDGNFRNANIDTNNITQTNVTALNNRLISCQHLELLYLLKHDELMKTFAFLLTLYKKYEYAIKILLFILKNIFTAKDIQPVPPGVAPGAPPYAPGATPFAQGNMQIRMPKAIIKNIKKLLEDQKKVSDVITQMQANIRHPNLENLLDPQHQPTRENLTNPPGNLVNTTNP